MGRGVLHPERRERKEGATRECGTGGVPHPLLTSANTLQPFPTSKVPTEEQTLRSHPSCALQGPLLLPRPCAGDTNVLTERDWHRVGICSLFFIPGSNPWRAKCFI